MNPLKEREAQQRECFETAIHLKNKAEAENVCLNSKAAIKLWWLCPV